MKTQGNTAPQKSVNPTVMTHNKLLNGIPYKELKIMMINMFR